MSEWISIEEQKPVPNVRILTYGIPTCNTCSKIWQVRESKYYGGSNTELSPPFYFAFGEYDCGLEVTHWMPLPAPPKDCIILSDGKPKTFEEAYEMLKDQAGVKQLMKNLADK